MTHPLPPAPAIDAAGEIDRLRRALAAAEEARDGLAGQLVHARAAADRASAAHAAAEARASELTMMCVAAMRLHESLEPSAVAAAVREVVINVVGSEEFVVVRGDDGPVQVVAFEGVDPGRDFAAEPWVRAALQGEGFVRPADAEAPVACVPLQVDGAPYGALVIYGLLPHKGGWRRHDAELLEMLGTHAATALRASQRIGAAA